MRERTNIMLEKGIKIALQKLADNAKMSLSDIINQRLSGTLTLEEQLGDKPEWMKDLEPYLATHFSNMEIQLPEPLKEYQEKMDELDAIINNILILKDYFRTKYRNEVRCLE